MSVADKDEESVTKGDDVNEIVVTTISSSVVPSTSPSTLSSSIPLSQSSFSTDSPIVTTESITETRDILADIPDIKITVMERMPEPDTEMQVISDEDIVPEEMQDDVMLEFEEVEFEDIQNAKNSISPINPTDQVDIRKSRTVPSFGVVEEREDLAGKVSDGRTEAYKDILDSLEFELNPTAEVVETSHGVTVFVNEEISLNSEEIADDKR